MIKHALAIMLLGAASVSAAEFLPMEISGELTAQDARDKVRTGAPCKLYSFPLAKDRTYVIDMIGEKFDSFLRLEDSEGKQLAQDDDSGGNLNARIQFKASKDDIFTVAVTSFNGMGRFTLKIRQLEK